MEKNANTVDVSLCTSSSSLFKPRAERIINKHLKKDIPPPWGNSTADNWRNRSGNQFNVFLIFIKPVILRTLEQRV